MAEETSTPVPPEPGPQPPLPAPVDVGLPPMPPAELPPAAVAPTPEPPAAVPPAPEPPTPEPASLEPVTAEQPPTEPPPAEPVAPAPEPPPPVAAEAEPTPVASVAPSEPAPVPEPPPVPVPVPEPPPAPEPVAEKKPEAPPARKPRKEKAPEPKAEPEPEPVAVAVPAAEAAPDDSKKWYVVKVQSGREESIKEAIERRVKIEGLEEFYGQILIPVEKVTEVRAGKRYVKSRKLYPGYIMANVEFNDRILYLFRETSGVGDFVGGSINKPPQPMKPHEVEKMMGPKGGDAKEIVQKHKFSNGDRVRVRDGTFSGMEGEIKDILEAKNSVRVELTIFGRPVPVELEYWQVETV